MIGQSTFDLETQNELKAKSEPEWDKLFNRKSGWTGADGIYSIPLSGREFFNEHSDEKTILLFSDTFISEVDEKKHRHNNVMINNTYAVMDGARPNAKKIIFNWAINDQKEADTVFKPDLDYANIDDWFWLMDGICIGPELYIFALRLENDPNHIFNFKVIGVSLITTSLEPVDKIDTYTQVDTPLFYKGQNNSQDIVFGQAIMPLIEQSSNPDVDGYIYIYGPRGSLIEKEMLASRVKPNNFNDISKWRFWDGSTWSPNIEECYPITTGISQEFSVSPLGNGRFILVFLRKDKVGIRVGESPVGPFGPIKYIWDCPEVKHDPDIYVYNAKAHPHLSKPLELLISYNVNSHSLERHDYEADLYRPRFISLQLASGE